VFESVDGWSKSDFFLACFGHFSTKNMLKNESRAMRAKKNWEKLAFGA